MPKPSLEHIFKELSHIKPSLLARKRLRLRLWFKFLTMRIEHSLWAQLLPKVATACVAIFVIGTASWTTVYAYQSDHITSDNILYPIKVIGENIILQLAKTPADKAETYLSFAEKRTREVKSQVEIQKTIDPNTVVAIDNNNKQALIAAQSISDSEEKKVIEKKIVAVSQEQVKTLRLVKAEAIKIEAEKKDIPLEILSKEDISLGSGGSTTNNQSENKLELPQSSTSEQIVANSPEISVVDKVLSNTKHFIDIPVKDDHKQELPETSSGSSMPGTQQESVSLSTDQP
jgi:DNA gyrase/topoisomerase IV subunit A